MMYELKELDARKSGIEEGIEIGEKRGEARGEAKGAELMAKLTTFLALEGKIDDIIRAGSDESFRKAKMKEYGLI